MALVEDEVMPVDALAEADDVAAGEELVAAPVLPVERPPAPVAFPEPLQEAASAPPRKRDESAPATEKR